MKNPLGLRKLSHKTISEDEDQLIEHGELKEKIIAVIMENSLSNRFRLQTLTIHVDGITADLVYKHLRSWK